jgi:cysteine desulfurase
MDVIYLDNNATTKPAPEVVQAMLPFLTDFYGNASSVHRFGQMARKGVEDARQQVASLVGAAPGEIVFTGVGTEAVNTAVRGLFNQRAPRKKIITSTVEHSATRELVKTLAKDEGAEVIEIPVDREGLLDLERFQAALSDDVALVTLMWANNETGVIFPIEKIGPLCRAKGVPIHTDATQAVGKIPVNFVAAQVDAATLAAHKFHGPKGVGGLFLRKGVRVKPLLVGGPQERSRRGGTENVAGIVGMGKAAELAGQKLPEMVRVAALRDRLEAEILHTIDDAHVNGSRTHRLPNVTNISFALLEAEAILMLLSEQGICASAGAACSSGSLEPSPVIRAMGVPDRVAHGAVRFSLSRYTTDFEVDTAIATLPPIISRLRDVLPVAAAAR